jgi:hypothetical protein
MELVMFRNTPATAQADRYVRVEFSYQTSETGTISIHKVDCGTEIQIIGLKMDLRSIFGAPEKQEWFHRTTKLADTKTLSHYNMNDRYSQAFRIYVKQAKSDECD